MLCRVLRTKQAKHVRRSAPIFTSIILDAQEKSAKRKRAGFFAASCLSQPGRSKAGRCLRQKQPSYNESEARPADDTAELELGQLSKFTSALRRAMEIWLTATKGAAV